MKILQLTLNDAAADVALDEALLEQAETGSGGQELLRLWEPEKTMVVLGRSSPYSTEVNDSFCSQRKIPVIRRCSGGSAIVTGEGVLMYAALLSYELRPELKAIDTAHEFVMNKLCSALKRLNIDTKLQGICDLTLANRKVSGNALRCKRNWMVYHGTLLCAGADTGLIANCLGTPKRQPEYRLHRDHFDFITTLPASTTQVALAMKDEWNCDSELSSWPEILTHTLVDEKYSLEEWTKKVP